MIDCHQRDFVDGTALSGWYPVAEWVKSVYDKAYKMLGEPPEAAGMVWAMGDLITRDFLYERNRVLTWPVYPLYHDLSGPIHWVFHMPMFHRTSLGGGGGLTHARSVAPQSDEDIDTLRIIYKSLCCPEHNA